MHDPTFADIALCDQCKQSTTYEQAAIAAAVGQVGLAELLSQVRLMFSRSPTRLLDHLRTSFPRIVNVQSIRRMSDLSIELTAPNGKKYTQPTGLFINNEWVASSKGNKITSINPTNEAEITSVHAAEPEDVDKAVEAARAAFKGPWREMASTERGDLMYKLSQLVEENKELLATIETWDNGKACRTSFSHSGSRLTLLEQASHTQ